MPILSVIVPAYNEVSNIGGAIEDVLRHVAQVVPDVEIIVVDDGSKDGTGAVIERYSAQDTRIVTVSQANQGHGPALVNGLDRATGQWLLLLDSDRQVSLSSFAEHWAMTNSYDAILGLRRPRHDPHYRRGISVLMRLLMQILLGVRVRDGGCPYKLVRASVWRDARRAMRQTCWIPSVLLAASALKRTDIKSIELAIKHQARSHGPSTLNVSRLTRFCREGVADIVYFREHAGSKTDMPVGHD